MKPKLVFASIIALAALAPSAGFADSMSPGEPPAAMTPYCCTGDAEGGAGGNSAGDRRAVIIPTDARDYVKKCNDAGGKVIQQSNMTICGGLAIGLEIRW